MVTKDWVAWHRDYDADTPLARRLAAVQRHIRAFVDAAPPGPIRVVSMCAGEGRDVIGGLSSHPRRGDVAARLVELDPANAAVARASAVAAGMAGVSVVEADAGWTTAYQGAVPADLVLVCGVYGNIPDGDIGLTAATLPSLCAPGATTIWTRSRRDPDITPALRRWYADAGFTEIAFEPIADSLMTVGVARLARDPDPFAPSRRMFTFVTQRGGPPA